MKTRGKLWAEARWVRVALETASAQTAEAAGGADAETATVGVDKGAKSAQTAQFANTQNAGAQRGGKKGVSVMAAADPAAAPA